ncbi:hypothetical protein BpHYR1_048809 [Brachionus plicatilis]|uniref:Uncharacterized protein n=1 Tax=Brachionus plicatilis TaxID=10195 RepID=A0A3M7SNE8_BRAPC|nr:hypothetical protein BpHYR1_048809 [Brachionus plicatilis]
MVNSKIYLENGFHLILASRKGNHSCPVWKVKLTFMGIREFSVLVIRIGTYAEENILTIC